jgi:hypothetical protein
MKRSVVALFGMMAVVAWLVQGCGSSSSSATLTEALQGTLVPLISVSSPSASSGSSSASLQKQGARFASMVFDFLRFIGINHATPTSAAGTELDPKGFKAEVDALKGLLEKPDAGTVMSQVNFSFTAKTVNCYGPALTFTNHPDGACGGGQPQPPCDLPTGDLGLWTATESTTGESCAAAKANAVIASLAGYVSQALKVQAAVAVAATKAGLDPATHSGTTQVSVTTGKSDFAISEAAITTTADGTDKIFITDVGGALNNKTVDQKLTNDYTDSNTYHGCFTGVYPNGNGWYGFGLIYSVEGTTAKYLLTSGYTRNINSSTPPTSFINETTCKFNFTDLSNRENLVYALAQIDTQKSVGTLYFAWSAGGGDDHTRVLRINTTGTGVTGDTGVAYFGYGPAIGSVDGSITTMICNWAGPSNNHTGKTGYAQAQLLTRNVSGIFEPATSYITYAPTNLCNNTSGTFTLNGSSAGTINNNLVLVDSQGTIPTITAPSYP